MPIKRVLSMLIDISFIILFELLFFTFIGERFFESFYVSVFIAYLFAMTLLAFLQSIWGGRTIGKWIFKLQVVSDSDKRLTFFKYWLRYMVAYLITFISAGVLFVISLLMVFIRKDHKTIYDIIVNTHVQSKTGSNITL